MGSKVSSKPIISLKIRIYKLQCVYQRKLIYKICNNKPLKCVIIIRENRLNGL